MQRAGEQLRGGARASGVSSRRHRLAWKISPAKMRSRQLATACTVGGGAGGGQAQRRRRASRGRVASHRGRSRCVSFGAAQQSPQPPQARHERRRPLRRGQRLEPPVPGRVQPQHVVVVGEMMLGHRDRPRRPLGDALDQRRQPVAEPAEPAAADRVGGEPVPARRRAAGPGWRTGRAPAVRRPATASGHEPTIAPPPAQLR